MQTAVTPSVVDTVTPRSQHEVRALASMVVASLPFPPLPVMVLQGEDGVDGMASSYDLLQTAVTNNMLGVRIGLGQDAELIARSKQAVLEQLQRDLAALLASSFCADFPDWQAYQILCDAFREYFVKHYATNTHDMRFFPMDSVDVDSLLMRQGSSHWNAGRILAGEFDSNVQFTSYQDLIRVYALDLATLEE